MTSAPILGAVVDVVQATVNGTGTSVSTQLILCSSIVYSLVVVGVIVATENCSLSLMLCRLMEIINVKYQNDNDLKGVDQT